MTSGGLVLTGVSVSYGRARALSDVSAHFVPGCINAVVGPNGAGKSSMLGAAYGIVPCDGKVLVDQSDISTWSTRRRAGAGLALVPQGRQIFPHLSVRENLQIMAELLGLAGAAVDSAMDRFPILRDRQQSPAGVLSGGEQQMLAVSRALMADIKVVLMDEMTTGLAPKIVQQLLETAQRLAADGAAVVLAEPSIAAIKHVVDRGIVLLRGEVVGVADDGDTLEQLYQERMGIGSLEAPDRTDPQEPNRRG
jgi:branched-chain amino acid transport system ATP-binding protein